MKLLLALLVPLFCLSLSACGNPDPVPPGPIPEPTGEIHAQLLQLHNHERTIRELPPFVENKLLYAAAQNHSDHMARVNRLGHFGVGDGTPQSRLNTVGYNAIAAGENVGAGQRDVKEIMEGWMASRGHRNAILGNYQEYGGAVATAANGTKYWTSCFGTPSGDQIRIIGSEPPREDGPQFKSGEVILIPPYTKE